MMNSSVPVLAALTVASLAAVVDLRTRRIPNALTFGAATAAVVYHAATASLAGAGLSLAGACVGVALFFPLFALGGMGAGDVKLLGALGAWLGAVDISWVAIYASLAGGVMAIGVAAWTGYAKRAMTNISLLLTFWRVSGIRAMPSLTLDTAGGPRLAYAVAILAGLVVTLWLRA